ALRERSRNGQLTDSDRDRLAVELFAHRASYQAGIGSAADVPLLETTAEVHRDDWYRVASGKGVWLLHELRGVLGDEAFEQAMDSFGRAHAGKAVTTDEFQAHVEKAAGKRLTAFFDSWLKRPGLPQRWLGSAGAAVHGETLTVKGEVRQGDKDPDGAVEG